MRTRLALAVALAALGVLLSWPAPQPAVSADAATGGPQPRQVTVVDHTYGKWDGLQWAINGWNYSPYVHLTIRDHCDPDTLCVIVRTMLLDSRRLKAITTPLEDNLTLITVDTAPSPRYDTYPEQASVMCHELGHALGLAHPRHIVGAGGCFAGGHTVTPSASPDDLRMLADLVLFGRQLQ